MKLGRSASATVTVDVAVASTVVWLVAVVANVVVASVAGVAVRSWLREEVAPEADDTVSGPAALASELAAAALDAAGAREDEAAFPASVFAGAAAALVRLGCREATLVELGPAPADAAGSTFACDALADAAKVARGESASSPEGENLKIAACGAAAAAEASASVRESGPSQAVVVAPFSAADAASVTGALVGALAEETLALELDLYIGALAAEAPASAALAVEMLASEPDVGAGALVAAATLALESDWVAGATSRALPAGTLALGADLILGATVAALSVTAFTFTTDGFAGAPAAALAATSVASDSEGSASPLSVGALGLELDT